MAEIKNLVDQLAEASMEARDLLRELRSELKEARRVRKELEEAVATVVAVAVDEAVVAKLADVTDGLQGRIADHQDALMARVTKVFEEQTNTCVYGNKQGRGPNIFEALREQAVRWERTMKELEL